MSLLARIRKGKAQDAQGAFHATATFAEPTRTVPIWVERNVRPVPTFDHPRVAVKELPHG